MMMEKSTFKRRLSSTGDQKLYERLSTGNPSLPESHTRSQVLSHTWSETTLKTSLESLDYFKELCITTKYTIPWQPLEAAIKSVPSPPLAFTMAMEMIIQASKWAIGGKHLHAGQLLPPICDYIDDMLTLISTVTCHKHLLEKLHDIITWAQMKLKHGKSRFYINELPILIVSKQPIKTGKVRSVHASNC